MSEEQEKPMVEPQDSAKENESPVVEPSQPENRQVNEEEQAQERKPEDGDNEEKNKTETQNVAGKDEDLFAGPYERLIDRKFIPDPNYTDTKILPTENFNSEIKPRRQFFYNILIKTKKRI